VQMAIDNFGAIKGFSLQRNDFLTLCDPASGANAANDIVANPQNIGVVGPIYSASTMGAAPVFETAGLVMISFANSNPTLPSYAPNVFNRVMINDPGSDGWAVAINNLASAVAWRTDFQSLYGRAPDWAAVFAYDATKIMLEHIDGVSEIDGSGNLVINRAKLATAVRTTVNFPGKTGSVSFQTNGDRVDPLFNTVWDDQFDSASLDPTWAWMYEDPTHWSLSDMPDFMRITTQEANANLLVRDAPLGNFEIRTHVLFTPTENYQIAALQVYGDDNNYLKLGRAFCDVPPPNCVGNGIYFDDIENGVFTGSNYAITLPVSNEVYLRIVRNGNTFTGYASPNGTSWTELGAHTVGFSPVKIGLAASNQGQPVTEIPADFDFFILQFANPLQFLPVINK
jgi:hypothetical protein